MKGDFVKLVEDLTVDEGLGSALKRAGKAFMGKEEDKDKERKAVSLLGQKQVANSFLGLFIADENLLKPLGKVIATLQDDTLKERAAYVLYLLYKQNSNEKVGAQMREHKDKAIASGANKAEEHLVSHIADKKD